MTEASLRHPHKKMATQMGLFDRCADDPRWAVLSAETKTELGRLIAQLLRKHTASQSTASLTNLVEVDRE
jgi:hypothetical protein